MRCIFDVRHRHTPVLRASSCALFQRDYSSDYSSAACTLLFALVVTSPLSA